MGVSTGYAWGYNNLIYFFGLWVNASPCVV